MTRVKICGLTNLTDALAAAKLGADAVGFVFAPRSKRRADPEAVAAISAALPPFVTSVGVFQDQPLEEVRAIMARCRLHVAQLHGIEDVCYMRELGHPVLKALSLSGAEDLTKLNLYPNEATVLLDSSMGGSGMTFDWNIAKVAGERKRIILAGGLDPANVGEAIIQSRPWGVDVAGGVEASPGVKDHNKLMLFFESVRSADGRLERER